MHLSVNSASDRYYYAAPAAQFPGMPAYSAAPEKSWMTKAEEFNDPKIRMEKRAGLRECQTCKNRKYQDGSNDPGVSFKAPGHIDPNVSGAVVMSHEQEHVRREQAKAAAENRRVVYQSVKLETGVCPECGRIYVSGGETRTVTKPDDSKEKKDFFTDMFKKAMSGYFGKSIDIRV